MADFSLTADDVQVVCARFRVFRKIGIRIKPGLGTSEYLHFKVLVTRLEVYLVVGKIRFTVNAV